MNCLEPLIAYRTFACQKAASLQETEPAPRCSPLLAVVVHRQAWASDPPEGIHFSTREQHAHAIAVSGKCIIVDLCFPNVKPRFLNSSKRLLECMWALCIGIGSYLGPIWRAALPDSANFLPAFASHRLLQTVCDSQRRPFHATSKDSRLWRFLHPLAVVRVDDSSSDALRPSRERRFAPWPTRRKLRHLVPLAHQQVCDFRSEALNFLLTVS